MSEKSDKNYLPIVLIVVSGLVVLVIAVIVVFGLAGSEDGTTTPGASPTGISEGKPALTEGGNSDSATPDLNENEAPVPGDEYDPDSDLSLSELNVILASGISAKDKLDELDTFIVNNGYVPIVCHNEFSDGLYDAASSKEALDYLNNLQSLPPALVPYVDDLKGFLNDNGDLMDRLQQQIAGGATYADLESQYSVIEEGLARIQLKHQVIDHSGEGDEGTGAILAPSRTCKYDITGLKI